MDTQIIVALIVTAGTVIAAVVGVNRRGKTHFDEVIGKVRTEIGDMRTENHQEHLVNQGKIADMKVDLEARIGEVRLDVAGVDRKIESHMAFHRGQESVEVSP